MGTMTTTQFFDELKRSGLKFRRYSSGKKTYIRTVKPYGDRLYIPRCPICALCEHLTGKLYQNFMARSAGIQLGLSREAISYIVLAADNDNPNSDRKQLEQACGLV